MPHAVQGSGATGHAAATINGLYVPLGHLVANQAYSSILDNLDDDQDLTFAMIQQACACKLRRGQDRGDDRRPDQLAMPCRPANPRPEHKDILRPKDSPDPSPETSLLSFVTSLSTAVSSLRGFSRHYRRLA
jgi:hypothetical protein